MRSAQEAEFVVYSQPTEKICCPYRTKETLIGENSTIQNLYKITLIMSKITENYLKTEGPGKWNTFSKERKIH